MKLLGFSRKQCSDVLLRLLEVYDQKWELIEDENYRALADAILDAQANSNGDPQPEPEQGEMDDDDIPAAGDIPSGRDPSTSVGPSPPSPTAQQYAATMELAVSPRADSPPNPRASTRLLGKRHRRTIDEDLQLDATASEELFRVSPPQQPDQNPKQIPGSRNSTIRSCRNQEMTTLSVEPTSSSLNIGKRSGVGNVQEAPSLDIDVASSPMGEVKMSLKCSVDPSKFRMPPLEEVFKMVESKCLRSYNALPPDFSVAILMTEMCQCVLQLGTEHTVEHNSTLAQQRRLALSTLRTNHDVTDISKGEEKVRISIINEFGKQKCPPSFYYIPQNIVFQNALVSMSFTNIGGEDCCADCCGNCLSSPEPCACARETGGEYAYTLQGLVSPAFIDECVSMNRFPEQHQKAFCETCPLEMSRNKASPEPCRGHLVRKFIKECWSKCGCNMQCGNRVVQRGITCNLQVFFTGKGRGWGLRTLDELPKGAFVCEYVGEILTTTELHERTIENMQNDRYIYPILLDAGWCSEKGSKG